ncbi:hypothetical protein J6590_066676 [Homalodisca vitripennis]|nr:hypothetical protein J6590_066676 [Homalodisca vitripennis]
MNNQLMTKQTRDLGGKGDATQRQHCFPLLPHHSYALELVVNCKGEGGFPHVNAAAPLGRNSVRPRREINTAKRYTALRLRSPFQHLALCLFEFGVTNEAHAIEFYVYNSRM